MKYFSMLIKPASSSCNLKCKYCFYNDVAAHRDIYNYGVMAKQTVANLVERTVGYFKEETQISFAFQGGEPTCAGLEYFKKFINKVNEYKKEYHHIHYSIQTNATLLNEEWIQFFKENNFLVGVSLDGFKENNDYFRIGNNNEGTYTKIMAVIQLLRKYGVEYNILTVLTSDLSKYPKKLYEFYKENDFKYIQLIPCLSEFEKENEYGLEPEEFSKFYIEFFDLWFEELKNNTYRSVALFDNIIPLFVGRPPMQCGYLGYCSMQFVIEADGSVYPCDFYVLDKYKIGNINEHTIVELVKSDITNSFIHEPRSFSKQCNTCSYVKICHGNCKRMIGTYYNDDFCGLREFLGAREKEIIAIANEL